MTYELSENTRRRAGRLATLSSCCGVTGETTLTDSAVIILFAAALNAGDTLTLISTSMLPFFNGLFILPAALLATRIGHRRMILSACAAGFFAYLAAVAAPFAGRGAVAMLIGAILLFTLTTPGFIACWNPLLDFFLRPEERVGFLGRMRFLHQLCAICFLAIAGWFIGRTPSVARLQVVLLAGAVIYAGRGISIARIHGFGETHTASETHLSSGLSAAVHDRSLNIFSAYQFVLNLMLYGGIPVAALYMKNALKVPGNLVVHVTNAGLVGMLAGYLAANALKSRVSSRTMFILLHFVAIVINILLATVCDNTPVALCCLAALLAVLGATVAASSVYCAAETMRLAPEGNKIVAMAWSCAFFYCGSGCSRLFSSFLLKSGLFCGIGGEALTPYQLLFLAYGILLIPALLLLFRIPVVRNHNPEGTKL